MRAVVLSAGREGGGRQRQVLSAVYIEHVQRVLIEGQVQALSRLRQVLRAHQGGQRLCAPAGGEEGIGPQDLHQFHIDRAGQAVGGVLLTGHADIVRTHRQLYRHSRHQA